MSSEIATTEEQMPNLYALQRESEFVDGSGLVGQGFNFLPRLQLFTSNSEECKRGKIGVAHYGLVKGKDELLDLGTSVVVIVCCWRSSAKYLKGERPLQYFRPSSPEFQAVKAAHLADSNSGNLFGPEYLVWLGATHGFATFFMGSETARNASGAVHAMLPAKDGRLKTGVLDAEYITSKKNGHSWHGPRMKVSNQVLDNPPPADLTSVSASFLNPVDSVKPEEAPAEAQNADR